MNVKSGDLAIIVRSITGLNEGLIVRVGKFIGEIPGWVGDDRWEIDKELPAAFVDSGANCGTANHCRDANLRRIDNPGEDATDEVIERLGKPVATPEGVTA